MLVQYKGSATDDYEPMLAESWEVAPDNTSATFMLPASATFHDGSACGAQEVKDSFTRFLLMDTGPVNVIKRFVTDPNQMEVVDPTTIRFNFDRPQPLFLAAMASEYGPLVVNPRMVEEHKTEEDPWAHEWFLINASGTGPYMLAENSPTERVVLQKYDGYHGGWEGNHFDQIVVRIVLEIATRRQLLENGDADATAMNLTPDDVESLINHPELNVQIYDSTAVFWTIMNAVRMKPKEARQGFSYAFPYDEVMNSAYRGLIARSGPLATTVRAYDPDVFIYQTDLAKAKELILAGGFNEGDTFDYFFQSGDEVETTIAQLFQANVQEMGFTLELQAVERGTIVDMVYGDAPAEERPMFMGGWSWWPDYNDPWNQFSPNFTDKTKDGISNGGYWLNERFEEIMAEAEHYTDEAQLAALMKEAQNILTEQDPPVIYYGQLKWYTILRKDIQGFVPNSLYLSSFPFYRMFRA
jgi:peptide/nickel transport system substrate-binding protein